MASISDPVFLISTVVHYMTLTAKLSQDPLLHQLAIPCPITPSSLLHTCLAMDKDANISHTLTHILYYSSHILCWRFRFTCKLPEAVIGHVTSFIFQHPFHNTPPPQCQPLFLILPALLRWLEPYITVNWG